MKRESKQSENQKLIRKIRERIRWDVRVSNADMSIRADLGNVILSGVFDHHFRQAAAIDLITSTEGILRFEDRSTVVPQYTRSDDELEFLIHERVHEAPLLPTEWVNVEARDGAVRLTGVVFRPRMKAFAAQSAWELSGVQDCVNLIEIQDYTSRTRPRAQLRAVTLKPNQGGTIENIGKI